MSIFPPNLKSNSTNFIIKLKKSKIYTRTGDNGTTSLVGGVRVGKDDLRLETYGTLDELSAHLGLLRSYAGVFFSDEIVRIQEFLLLIGANLASETGNKLTKINESNFGKEILWIESCIDKQDAELQPLKNFVLSGKNTASAAAHVCRTVCRRFERRLYRLQKEQTVDKNILVYTNRLSDFLFIVARLLEK